MGDYVAQSFAEEQPAILCDELLKFFDEDSAKNNRIALPSAGFLTSTGDQG